MKSLLLMLTSVCLTILSWQLPPLLMLASGKGSDSPALMSVLTVVPTVDEQDNLKHEHQWKKGEEILPAALLALEEINSMSDIMLNGSLLDIVPVRVPLCDLNQGVIPFVEELTMKEEKILGIVGYFCQNIAQVFSQVVSHKVPRVIQISANPLCQCIDQDCTSPYQYSILPSFESNARAAILFLKKVEWNRVAVISNNDINYETYKHKFLTSAVEYAINVEVQIAVSYVTTDVIAELLQELLRTGIKIVITFVSPSEAVQIICNAHLSGFKWPDYAWIFMENDIKHVTEMFHTDLCPNSQTSIKSTLSNTLSLHAQFVTVDEQTLPSGLNYDTYHESYHQYLSQKSLKLNQSLYSNPFATVIYDSIWAIAIALNRSLSILTKMNLSIAQNRRQIVTVIDDNLKKLSFQGATGFLNFSQNTASSVDSVTLTQYQNGQLKTVGVYDSNVNYLFLNVSTNDFPTVTLDRIYVLYPVPLTIILTIVIGLCFVLTTVSMCLFFYYRKQPAIKATSSTLSICMFIGCYFLLTSSMFHTISSAMIKQYSSESLRAFICCLDVYLISIGFDTVFATVVAKTLRIYHIFKTFGRINHICSDKGLLVLILTIIFIKIAMLTLWTAVDTNHLVDVEEYIVDRAPPYYLVKEQCQSNNLNVWVAFIFGYSLLLLFILVVLAIMTRKIKRRYFNESKKISLFSVVLLFHASTSVILWSVLRTLNNGTIPSKVVYSLSTMLTAFFCQAFLILPKVVPLVQQGKPFHTPASIDSNFSTIAYKKFASDHETQDTVVSF